MRKLTVDERMALEREVVTYLLGEATKAGFDLVLVDDGGDRYSNPTMQAALETVFSVDESSLMFKSVKDDAASRRFVSIILGNDGYDCIADHSYEEGDPDGFLAMMDRVTSYAEKRFEALTSTDANTMPLGDPDKALGALQNIQLLLEEANNVFSGLSRVDQNVLMDVHVADRSLGILLRDAHTTTEELIERFGAARQFDPDAPAC